MTRLVEPAAPLLPVSEDDLDRVMFERSVVVRKAVLEGLRDLKAGRVISAREYIARRFRTRNSPRRKQA